VSKLQCKGKFDSALKVCIC